MPELKGSQNILLHKYDQFYAAQYSIIFIIFPNQIKKKYQQQKLFLNLPQSTNYNSFDAT
jgi:hypothetical protein